MPKIFVYGTLKSGQVNHYFLRHFEPTPAIALQISLHTGHGLPFATHGQGQVIGEVYTIDEKTLILLDRFEGHPFWYRREIIPVQLESREIVMAWIYLNDEAHNYPKILNGNWQEGTPISNLQSPISNPNKEATDECRRFNDR